MLSPLYVELGSCQGHVHRHEVARPDVSAYEGEGMRKKALVTHILNTAVDDAIAGYRRRLAGSI